MPRWLLAGLLVAVAPGCLPKGSVLRRDELEADTYALTLAVDVTTDGVELPPFRWQLDGTVDTSFTRSFRDGSLGTLVRFDGMKGRIEREGAPPVDAPVGIDGAFVELRTFPDGEVLTITGSAPWLGATGHLDALDLLWPVISPHLPDAKELHGPFATSWSTAVPGGPRVRTRLVSQWTGAHDGHDTTLSYDGALDQAGGNVEGDGHAHGSVLLGSGAPRVMAHTFDWSRTVHTVWSTGARVTQRWHTTGSLRHTGTAPSPPLAMPVGPADATSDALPLHLRDGRVAEDHPVDLAAALPFVLLPDDLPDAERARLHAALAGTGTVSGGDPRP